ncbi:MAG: hypothetical protein HY347_06275 [candidate division NC10 bacterium]|nr:hypothetical protein [candidate division NC10 bacterium]
MRRGWAATTMVILLAAITPTVVVFDPAHAQQRQLQPGVFMEVLKSNDSVDAAIERGRKFFNDIGCAGCHPRGGTIGGTAVDVAGNRNPIPIPALKESALHFPRIIGGKVVNLGQLNDL